MHMALHISFRSFDDSVFFICLRAEQLYKSSFQHVFSIPHLLQFVYSFTKFFLKLYNCYNFSFLCPFLSKKKEESPLPSFCLKICIILWFPAPADGIVYILHISMITAFHLLRPQECFQRNRPHNQ